MCPMMRAMRIMITLLTAIINMTPVMAIPMMLTATMPMMMLSSLPASLKKKWPPKPRQSLSQIQKQMPKKQRKRISFEHRL